MTAIEYLADEVVDQAVAVGTIITALERHEMIAEISDLRPDLDVDEVRCVVDAILAKVME